MTSIEHFNYETFAGRLGEAFRILPVDGGDAVETSLVEATKLTAAAGLDYARPPFSIVFRGPTTPALRQGIHRFEHEALGAFELFIVPIEPDADGPRYEAIFT